MVRSPVAVGRDQGRGKSKHLEQGAERRARRGAVSCGACTSSVFACFASHLLLLVPLLVLCHVSCVLCHVTLEFVRVHPGTRKCVGDAGSGSSRYIRFRSGYQSRHL